MEQKETLTIKVLSGCTTNLNADNLDITGDKNKYPSTLKKFPTRPEVKVHYIETNLALPDKAVESLDKFSISFQFSQGAAAELHHKGIKPLVVLFANAFHPGGHGETMSAQEERVLADSNANYAIPKNYGEGLILTYDGLYVISDALIKVAQKDIPVDFVFVAMPDLRCLPDNGEFAYANAENRAAYLRHITSLVILQFYAAKLTGKMMVTGRQGCGVFGNNDEDIAAVIHAVANLPQFKEIKVVFALGQNRQYDHIYLNPPKGKLKEEVDNCIKSIQDDIGRELNINAVSDDLRERYCKKVNPALMNKRLESFCITNKVKESFNKTFGNLIDEIVPFWGTDGLPRYRFKSKHKGDGGKFSQGIFELGIGAQTDPNRVKFYSEQPGTEGIIFTKGQFDLLKFNVFSQSAIDKSSEKFSKEELNEISKNVSELEECIKNKMQTGVLAQAPELKTPLDSLNALKVLLKLNIKGYPRAVILQYIQAEYPQVTLKLMELLELLESAFIINNVKESLNKMFGNLIDEIVPFRGIDGLLRYRFKSKHKVDGEKFSQEIFELGIGAQTDSNRVKFYSEQPGAEGMIFTKGQFDLLKFNVSSQSAIDKSSEKFSKEELNEISKNVSELEECIKNKMQTGVLAQAPELKTPLDSLNALKVLLKLNIKGYPRAVILQYIQAEYPEVSFKLKALLNSFEKAVFVKEPISKDYELFCPAGMKNPEFLEILIKEMNENKRDYAFAPDDVGRQRLREICRKAHGYEPQIENGDIRFIFEGGVLAEILSGKDAKITDFNQKVIIINAKKIQQYQRDVEIIHNDKISAQDILRIQNIKSGRAAVRNETEKNELESKGKNFLIRGQVDQYFDEKGCAWDESRPRIFYYACFPDLRKSTADFKEFVDNDVIKDKEKYKDSVKDVVGLMLRMAHQHGEAIDILTPNAFFAGLSNVGQQEAKKLFADAVLELISEKDFETNYSNVPAVILHADGQDEMKRAMEAKKDAIKIPIILNAGDASSPQYAAIKKKLPFRVAEALMGDVLGPTGNGALGSRANQAKEENDTRKTASCLTLVFNAMFNPIIITKIYELDKTLGSAPKEQPYQCFPAFKPNVNKFSASLSAHK